MNFLSQTRADARALISAALAGAAVGLALGACYLAGGLASAASHHQTASRVADATEGRYSTAALIGAPGADAGALAVMRRRDPALLADADQGRQLNALAGRLQQRAAGASADTGARLLLRASLGGAYNPAAAPFTANALQGARDLDCLTQAVYYEARGEGPSGQAAVAQVVLNRVRHPSFPKTVCGVVFQRAGARSSCQFSFACDGSLRRPRETAAWKRAERVATRAMAGSVMAEVGNATHFHTTGVAPAWGPSLMRVAQVGLHVFYRFGGRNGAPGAFTRQPDLSGAPDPAADLVVASLNASSKAAASVALAAVATAAPALAPGGMGGPAAPAGEPASAPEPKSAAASEPVKAVPTAAVTAPAAPKPTAS